MNLVDSSGWLEYFADAKNAKYFAPAIENTKELIVSTINIYEIYKKILVMRDENTALEAIALMYQGKVIDVTSEISIEAARLSAKNGIPMADSLIYITARKNSAIIWTQDYDFKNLDGVKFIKK
ncbi:MAG: type II toxin-antitoxin system VapC family toxin [Chlorobi bacterium]|nr:type II toxin-antitoxin system VapC family toxin [Chlorobiota bacterium]